MRYLYVFLFLFALVGKVQSADLPLDPWQGSNPVDDRVYYYVRNGIGDKPGELDKYKMDRTKYTGEATTFGTATGQEMIAPEVNTTNILLMTNHLRKLGFQIPASYDDKIKNAPAWLRQKYMAALNELNNAYHSKSATPETYWASNVKRNFESASGLSLDNFIETSLKIMEGR